MQDGDTILETERLRLRYQRAADVEALVALWTDPEVMRYMGGPRDTAQVTHIFEETARAPRADAHDLWVVVERGSGRVVGHCGLLDKEVEGREEIELVYVIARDAWGQGYATEMARALVEHAFGEMGLQRLISLIEPENAASERVAEKVGMRLEREVVRPGGAVRRVYRIEKGE